MSQDRQQRLAQFVDWTAQHITGDEKGEAQIFLDRLFQAFAQRGLLEVGGTPEFRIKPGKDDDRGTSFADYVWKAPSGGVLIEMKKRGEDLARHRQQAFDYWIKLVPNRPQYTVLCNFDEFRIYDFNIDLDDPLDTVTLTELPQRYEPLAFLFPTAEKPIFQNNRIEVTRNAADRLATVFNNMMTRKVDRALAQRFGLQMLVALFAEDIDLLPKNFVTNLLSEIKEPQQSYDLLGDLFEAMNRPNGTAGGRFKGIRYFNGGLFSQPARVELDLDTELPNLRQAAKYNWSKVSPEIFGTLFQDSMDKEQRHAFGAHYTAPIDIMKIVKPTIVDPWSQLIDAAKTPKKLADLLERLSLYTVLDPACGSGNFLYIAYRELKRVETKIRDRLRIEFPDFQATLHHVTARQFHGMDILPFAIELAKVTMMIARKLAIDELHIADEPPLPLDNLDSNFKRGDSLVDESGFVTPWEPTDVIIGNPPFLDARKMTMEHGREYVGNIERLFPEIPRRADYCTYWLRRAHDHLPVCTPDRPESGRAGLVGTQNIRNNEAREGGLDHIVGSGTIVEAVENQPWSGEANVHVSIANWVKTATSVPPTPKSPGIAIPGLTPTLAKQLLIPEKKKLWFKTDPKLAFLIASKTRAHAVSTTGKRGRVLKSKSYELDYRECAIITSSLSDKTDVSASRVLKCNRDPKVVFEGVQTGHDGFVINDYEAQQLIKKKKEYKQYIKPFINGTDLLSGRYLRKREFVIDLSDLDMIEASALADLIAIPRERVLKDWQLDAKKEREETEKDRGEHQNRMDAWWALKRPRNDLQRGLHELSRYIACSALTTRPIFVFLASSYIPTNALKAFLFEDDYSFGVIQSAVHRTWFWAKCSNFKADPRYTPESVFDTFPWPQSPTKKQIDAVAAAGREIRRIRTEALQKIPGGLRALYRTLELPGQNPLKDAHAVLDTATLTAYGFNAKDDLLSQLLTLNLAVATNIDAGKPVTAPGVPAAYGDPAELITKDCIQP